MSFPHFCKRCGFEWESKLEKPLVCSRCRSYKWQLDRKPYTKEITYEINENGCHVCTSHHAVPLNYPQIQINKRRVKIHRYLYEKEIGVIPPGMQVLHKCDNRHCINSNHFFLGTNMDNIIDKVKKGRQGRARYWKNGRTRLTLEQVYSIREDSRTHNVIAVQYGVARTTITAIKRRKNWYYV